MKNNTVYMPQDALSRREDFDIWYADSDLALSVKGTWSGEGDRVSLIGRMGGENGCIKPDFATLSYYMKLERYEYVLRTHVIFSHYSVEGMLWQVHGTLANPPLDCINEATSEKDVHIRLVDFKDKGACFEIKVKDVAKLRIAAATVIAIAIKEEYKGKSEGEKNPNATRLEKLKSFFLSSRGKTYEELLNEKNASRSTIL